MKRLNKAAVAAVLMFLALPSWAQVVINPGGGGSGTTTVISGTTPCTGGADKAVIFNDGGTVNCAETSFTWDKTNKIETLGTASTAGNAITLQKASITGGSATSNFLNITGTFPATLTAATNGAVIAITGDDDAQAQRALDVTFTPVGTPNVAQSAFRSTFATGQTLNSNYYAGEFVYASGSGSSLGSAGALRATASGAAAGHLFGILGEATGASAKTAGVIGLASAGITSRYGVLGFASGASTDNFGGYFTLATAIAIPSGQAALVGDNGAIAQDSIESRTNGVVTWSTNANGYVENTRGEVALNADYTNATTTFSNTNLSVTLVSGRTYSIDVNLLMSDSTAADGMKIDFAGGGATATLFRLNCLATNDTTGATVAFTAATSNALATVLNIGAMASTGTHMVRCSGTFVPSSSSTFIVRAAQNAHTTGTLTITRGSWMSVRDARPL